MSSLPTEPLLALLTHALDVAQLRQAVHSANIANAGVAGYQRLEVSFESELAQALGPDADGSVESQAVDVRPAARPEVHLEQEMALMAKDALHYEALLGALTRSVGLLDLAIKEGRP